LPGLVVGPDVTPDPVSVSVHVDAPAEVVYDLVSDVTGQHRFTEECTRSQWVHPATGPEVGAVFRGSNRNGPFRWATTSEVVSAEPGRRFGFRVRSLGMDIAEWEYLIEPAEHGCRVTETTYDRRNAFFRYVVAPLATGVWDRAEHNRRNIERTLDQLRQVAEQRV
jgi:hypothetical protein